VCVWGGGCGSEARQIGVSERQGARAEVSQETPAHLIAPGEPVFHGGGAGQKGPLARTAGNAGAAAVLGPGPT
jgi:hypothetical protein